MTGAIDSNKQLFAKLQNTSTPQMSAMSGVKLMPALEKDEVIIYNDPEAIEEQKKKKLSKGLLLGTTALAGVAAVATVSVGLLKGKYKNINVESAKGFLQKTAKTLECAGSNFSNVRDDLTTKLVDGISNFKFSKNSDFRPFKFVDTLKGKCLGIYDYFLEKIGKEKYNKAFGEITRLQKEGKLPKNIDIPTFDDWFKSTFDATKKALHDESFAREYFNKNMTPKEFMRKFTNEITANERLQKAGILKDAIEITDDIKANPEALRAVTAFNKANSEILEKMRDNTLGNALGDFIGAGVVTGTLATGIALESNPDERKSKAINLGIPVGTTILGMIFGNAFMLPAIKSMIMGMALGGVGSITANFLTSPPKNPTQQDAQV